MNDEPTVSPSPWWVQSSPYPYAALATSILSTVALVLLLAGHRGEVIGLLAAVSVVGGALVVRRLVVDAARAQRRYSSMNSQR